MKNVNTLRRSAYHLISVSTILQVIALFSWLSKVFISPERYLAPEWYLSNTLVSHPWSTWMFETTPTVVEVLLVTLPTWLGMAWALLRLRYLAKALYFEQPISHVVANQFKRLSEAVAILLIVMLFGGQIMAKIVMPEGASIPPSAIGISVAVMLFATILVLRAVSLLIREACDIDEENQRFV